MSCELLVYGGSKMDEIFWVIYLRYSMRLGYGSQLNKMPPIFGDVVGS